MPGPGWAPTTSLSVSCTRAARSGASPGAWSPSPPRHHGSPAESANSRWHPNLHDTKDRGQPDQVAVGQSGCVNGSPADSSYDRVGVGYSRFRNPDPRIEARLMSALGDARTVVNVGAGSGSYEPADRVVLAVEPSEVMVKQRPPGAAPCIRATAERLPFFDQSFDAAMGILTIHHWCDPVGGLRELVRVARRVVLFAYEPTIHRGFWLWQEYFPAAGSVAAASELAIAQVAEVIGADRSRAFSCPTIAQMASDRPIGAARPPILTPVCAVAYRALHGSRRRTLNLDSSAYARTSILVLGRPATEISLVSTRSTPAFASSCERAGDRDRRHVAGRPLLTLRAAWAVTRCCAFIGPARSRSRRRFELR
jgi:SAM-dependent methyltransferase